MIKIFTTGGTIGGLEYANTKHKSSNHTIDISELLQKAKIQIEYDIEYLFDKDSRHITPKDLSAIKQHITSSNEHEILITHGTYTMIETAKYLGELNLNKIIVLVGSFILGSDLKTDAPENLSYALTSFQNLNNGVYIAMNHEIFDWHNVRKNIRKNRFEKLNT